jgi:hypothetical protein
MISSAMNFEFVQSGSTVDFPGFVPADAHDVHVALDAINKDLDKRFPGRFTKRDVVGLWWDSPWEDLTCSLWLLNRRARKMS